MSLSEDMRTTAQLRALCAMLSGQVAGSQFEPLAREISRAASAVCGTLEAVDQVIRLGLGPVVAEVCAAPAPPMTASQPAGAFPEHPG